MGARNLVTCCTRDSKIAAPAISFSLLALALSRPGHMFMHNSTTVWHPSLLQGCQSTALWLNADALIFAHACTMMPCSCEVFRARDTPLQVWVPHLDSAQQSLIKLVLNK